MVKKSFETKCRLKKGRRTTDEMSAIRVYAENYHSPISDIRGFNKMLIDMKICPVRKQTLSKILGYV